jgi:hypothetical protein
MSPAGKGQWLPERHGEAVLRGVPDRLHKAMRTLLEHKS